MQGVRGSLGTLHPLVLERALVTLVGIVCVVGLVICLFNLEEK